MAGRILIVLINILEIIMVRNNIYRDFLSNVPDKSDFFTMCLGYYIPDPVLSGGLVGGVENL